MKVSCEITMNLKIPEALKKVEGATRLGLKDTIKAICNDVVKNSRKKTGHNMRSIAAEVSGMGVVASGGEGGAERVVNDSELEGAVYSTSGYGGYLEIGTGIYGPLKQPITPKNAKILAWQDKSGNWIFAKSVKGIPARPYFYPAFSTHKKELIPNIKKRLEETK